MTATTPPRSTATRARASATARSKAFRDGQITTLVATDVAARGIDIPGVAYVINYELPDTPDNYVHRIGRTARAGREGEAIAFCCAEEVDLLVQIEKVMKVEIPVSSGTRPKAVKMEKPRRGGGGGWRGPVAGAGRPRPMPKPHGAEQRPANPGQKRRRPRRRGGVTGWWVAPTLTGDRGFHPPYVSRSDPRPGCRSPGRSG